MKDRALPGKGTSQKMQKMRKIFLWLTVLVLAVGAILGAILGALVGDWGVGGKIMLIAVYTAVAGFLIPNILSIKHTTKRGKSLKTNAIIGVAFLWSVLVIATLAEPGPKDMIDIVVSAFIVAALVSVWSFFGYI